MASKPFGRTALWPVTTLISLASASIASPAMAGGFYLQEQSPEGTGRAFAGEAAAADSAATIYFNPAGMTELDGTQIVVGVHLLDIDARQDNRGSTRSIPGGTTVPTGGGDGGNPFYDVAAVPVGYLSHRLSERLWLGLGINAPFGLVVDYEDDFFARYDSRRSELRTYNAQPSVAYRVDDRLSVGFGLSIQYVEAELTNALPQPDPAAGDGFSRVAGDDVSLGWNAGLAYEVGGTRLGVHFRSGIDHEIRGDFTIEDLAGPLAAANGERDARAQLRLPSVASIGIRQAIGPDLRLLAGASWYNWSVFETIDATDGGDLLLSSEQGYRDTFDISVGGEYDVSEALTLRAGFKWDETPTGDRLRTTRVPDGDRYWATAGLTWRTGRFAFAASYAHIFVDASTIAREERFYEGTPAQVVTTTNALTRGNVDQIALSIGVTL